MPKAKPPPVVIDFCCALVKATATGGSHYWVSVYGIRETLGVPRKDLDQAIAYAIDAGLVWAEEVPPRSLTVTYDGIELASASRP